MPSGRHLRCSEFGKKEPRALAGPGRKVYAAILDGRKSVDETYGTLIPEVPSFGKYCYARANGLVIKMSAYYSLGMRTVLWFGPKVKFP
jgi:hypothetical protein